MKTCLTIIVSFLVCYGTFAQNRYVRNFNDDVHTLIPCQDSTFYAISIHPGCGINSFSIHYLNRNGQIIWSKESPLWISHLYDFKGYTDAANTLTIVYYSGNNNGLTRIDEDGNILFNRAFNPNTYQLNNILPDANGFFLTGIQYPYSADPSVSTLLHMNNNGEVDWVKSYSIPTIPRLIFHDIIRSGDSLLIAGHYTEDASPEVTYPCLIKTDLAGNVGSSYYYRIETIDVDRYQFWEVDSYDPSTIYLKFRASSGVDGILKINDQLEVDWAQNYVGDLGTICAAYDGSVLFTGSFAFNGDVAKMDAQGNVVSSSATNALPSISTPSQIQRHDCGYLVSLPIGWPDDRFAHISTDLTYCQSTAGGNASTYEIPTVNRLEMTATAQNTAISGFSMFNISGTYTAISTTETVDCEETYNCSGPLSTAETVIEPLEIYPNPVTEILYFDSKGEPVRILNAAGVVVFSGQLSGNELPVADFAPGMYQLLCGNRYGRFVKH